LDIHNRGRLKMEAELHRETINVAFAGVYCLQSNKALEYYVQKYHSLKVKIVHENKKHICLHLCRFFIGSLLCIFKRFYFLTIDWIVFTEPTYWPITKKYFTCDAL